MTQEEGSRGEDNAIQGRTIALSLPNARSEELCVLHNCAKCFLERPQLRSHCFPVGRISLSYAYSQICVKITLP